MPFVYRIFQGVYLGFFPVYGFDTIPLEPSWVAVGWPTGSPVHATGARLSDLHELRSGGEPTIPYGNIPVAE